MNLNVIAVGSIKESYLREALQEYSKRLSRYVRLTVTEVKDEKTPEGASAAEEERIRMTEGKRILSKLREDSFLVALAIRGSRYTSEQFAAALAGWEVKSRGNLFFVIGGSLGLADEVLKRANVSVSFSDLTFPHQLMRVILLEQIYRGYRILNGEPYHK